MRRRPAHLLLAVAVLLPSACGQDTEDDEAASPRSEAATPASEADEKVASPPAVASSGLRVEVGRSRLFATQHQLRLGLTNGGEVPVTVATIQLDSSRFEPVAPNRRDSTLGPGREVSMPLDYGAATCTDGDAESATSSALVVVDGETLLLPLDEPSNIALADLQAEECEVAMIAEAVEVSFDDDVEETGPGEAKGHVVLTQQAEGAAAELHELRGTVIFEIDPGGGDGDALLAVADGEPQARLPVTISASRCDPHALIESKKTFVFTAMVVLDDGEERPVAIQPEGPSRLSLDALLESCLPDP